MGTSRPNATIRCDVTSSEPRTTAALMAAVRQTPVDHVVARPDQIAAWPRLDRVEITALVTASDQIAALPEWVRTVVVEDAELLGSVREHDRSTGIRWCITDAESMEAARQFIGAVDVLIVKFSDPTNIPLELLIAEAQTTRTRVVKQLLDLAEAPVVAGVLEHGPAGLLLAVAELPAVAALAHQLDTWQGATVRLDEMTVTGVRSIGMGQRGCIDTTTLFDQDEGMLVGSTSSGGLLICAEVHYLPYMNLRPFRVNAGAVHSYVFGTETTDYITDLSAGSAAWAVGVDGAMRPVSVGRVKIENRPLRLVEATGGGVAVNVILQDDWHVRVMGADGQPRNLTEVKVGDKLLGRICAPGRHVGIQVEEAIDER